MWIKVVLTVLFALEFIGHIKEIGEPREPRTKEEVIFNFLCNSILLLLIWKWA